MSIGIYKITSPNGSIYIGQSTNLEQRFRVYQYNNCKDMPKLYASFMEFGAANHIFEVIIYLDIKTPKELNMLEQYYIDYYRNMGFNVLNILNPAKKEYPEGHIFKSKSYPKSEQHKDNIRKAITGIKRTPEQCIKCGLAKKGQYPASAKRVIDLSTMTIYPSARVAAELFGYRHSTLKAMLNGQRKNKTTFIYENRGNNSSDE